MQLSSNIHTYMETIFFTYQFEFPDMRDYCEIDTFDARCANSKVILMQEAIYGRMELGTCLTVDLGFMGCFRWVFVAKDFHCYDLDVNNKRF